MALCSISMKAGRSAARSLLLLPALALLLAGCNQKKAEAPRRARCEPSRSKRAARRDGRADRAHQAEDEASLAFRIGGRMIERIGNVGDRVEPGQVLARLDPQNELNALRSAQAGLTAAQGAVDRRRATTSSARSTLLAQGLTTRAHVRSGAEGAADGAGAGRRRRGAAADRRRTRSASPSSRRMPPASSPRAARAGRGGAGRADDRAASRARAAATPCSTCRPR